MAEFAGKAISRKRILLECPGFFDRKRRDG
jgi:hypothetical protein